MLFLLLCTLYLWWYAYLFDSGTRYRIPSLVYNRELLLDFNCHNFILNLCEPQKFPKLLLSCKIFHKVEKISKGSPDLNPSPSPSVKIQIMGEKVCLMGKGCYNSLGKGKTLLGIVNNFFCIQMFVDNTQQCFAFIPFPPIFFTEGKGDGIKSRLSSYFFFYFIKNILQ